jgi:hypothetical protein
MFSVRYEVFGYCNEDITRFPVTYKLSGLCNGDVICFQ